MNPEVVDYASPVTRSSRRTNRTIAAALVCAMLPMSAGLLVTVLWLFTRSPSLKFIGFLVIVAGGFLFLAGGICCVVYIFESIAGARPTHRWLPRLALATLLLLLNFPLAHACITMAKMSRVRVMNNSAGAIKSFIVRDPRGSTWQLGPIAAGRSTSKWMTFDGEGAVTYTATTQLPRGTINTGGTINPYISHSMLGETHTVTINADGT